MVGWLPRGMTLSDETKAIVKSTHPVVQEHGLAITTRMYEKLFTEYPDTKAFFADTTPGQEQRLANAVIAYAANIDKIETLVPVVQGIAAKHVAAGVQAEHYPIVGEMLLGAMTDVLGELDASIVDAWAAAYGYLADIFISTEAELYAAAS